MRQRSNKLQLSGSARGRATLGHAFAKWKVGNGASLQAKILVLQRQKQLGGDSAAVGLKILAAVAEGACKIKRVKYVRAFQPVKELNQTRQSVKDITDRAKRLSSRKRNYDDLYEREKKKQKKVGFLDKMAEKK